MARLISCVNSHDQQLKLQCPQTLHHVFRYTMLAREPAQRHDFLACNFSVHCVKFSKLRCISFLSAGYKSKLLLNVKQLVNTMQYIETATRMQYDKFDDYIDCGLQGVFPSYPNYPPSPFFYHCVLVYFTIALLPS